MIACAVVWLLALGFGVAATVALVEMGSGHTVSDPVDGGDTPWLLYVVIGVSAWSSRWPSRCCCGRATALPERADTTTGTATARRAAVRTGATAIHPAIPVRCRRATRRERHLDGDAGPDVAALRRRRADRHRRGHHCHRDGYPPDGRRSRPARAWAALRRRGAHHRGHGGDSGASICASCARRWPPPTSSSQPVRRRLSSASAEGCTAQIERQGRDPRGSRPRRRTRRILCRSSSVVAVEPLPLDAVAMRAVHRCRSSRSRRPGTP